MLLPTNNSINCIYFFPLFRSQKTTTRTEALIIMPSVQPVSEMKTNVTYQPNNVTKLVTNHKCTTKVKIKDAILHSVIKLDNIPNPNRIGGEDWETYEIVISN